MSDNSPIIDLTVDQTEHAIPFLVELASNSTDCGEYLLWAVLALAVGLALKELHTLWRAKIV